MAKINPVKLKQDADKEEKAGRLDKAIALYRQIADDSPRDWNTIKKIGDLYARMNRVREASQEYGKVADFYERDGFLLKAIAVWKQINKLDASDLKPYERLADLYAKQGLMVEAKGQYQIVVDEYIKRGKVRDAGDALKKMADIDPGDLKVRSKLADLYNREGNLGKAVEEHVAIAEELNRKGHLAEALQVLEKGLKIDPKSARLRAELARVHLVQKNYEKAIHYLEEASRQSPGDAQVVARLGEAYLGAKRIEEAEAIFRRLLQQDPQDQEARTQMGRVFLMQGQFDQAYEQFLPVVEKLLERRDSDRASALLNQIVQRNPGHIKTLVKLVEIYRVLRKDSAVAATYSQMVEAFMNQGQMDQAASILEILVGLEPQNEQHRSKLEFVRGKGGRPAPVTAPGTFIEEDFELTTEAAPAAPRGFAAPPAFGAPAAGRPAIELSGPLSDEDREFIEEHLAEGRVFRKYGLVDKAADQFDAIVSRFPDNIEARQELRDIFKEKGQADRAAEQSRALAEICRLKGDRAAAERHEADAAEGAPAAAPPAARPAAAPAPTKPAPPAPVEAEEEIPLEVEESGLEAPELEPVEEELQSLDLGLEEAGQGEEELQAPFLEEEPPPVPAAPVPLPEDEFPMGEEEELSLEEPPPPPPSPRRPAPLPPPPRAAKAAPPPAAKPARAPAPKPAPSRIAPRAAAPAPPPPAARRARLVPKAAPPAAPARGLPPDLQKVLDEVDSYISLGFVDDAKEALAEVSSRHPGHPALAAKIAELGLGAEPAPPPAPPRRAPAPAPPRPAPPADLFEEPGVESLVEEPAPESLLEGPTTESLVTELEYPLRGLGLEEPSLPEPAAAAPGALDLGAELGEIFGAQSAVEEPAPTVGETDLGDAGLADIFKEFKKGVDKQLGKEDYDTRYNLGIAYKEMGLLDEAIAEFQLAAKDESRLLECSSMLGICFLEKGMAKLAVKWFEKGLQAPDRSEEEYQGLRYDLATALEASGETDKALNVYTDLYGQDANFRDVATKVRELRAALR